MARCNDCNKFVSLDSEQDPEITLDVDETEVTKVTYTVTIANACTKCGSEVTTASLDGAVSADDIAGPHPFTGKPTTLAEYLTALEAERNQTVADAPADAEVPEIEIEVEEGALERTSRTEGTGRGTKTFYGFRAEFEVTVTYGGRKATFSGSCADDVQASSMDTVS